ncbi:MAG: hypothetical protein M1823_000157 [Watsoniomyces obsoletus]|nr:MAG: hypothetical protein M1823_000157 [Watsoniomyces obsoletus]
MRKIWDVDITEGRCLDFAAVSTAIAALNVASDILIILLPMPLVWYFLSIPRKQKIALTAVFATGSSVCIVSMVRLKKVLASNRTTDITWAALDPILWGVVEINVGIACACMPTLKVLVRKIFPHALESSGVVSRETKSGTVPNKIIATAKANNNQNGKRGTNRKPSVADPELSENASPIEVEFGKETWELGETNFPTNDEIHIVNGPCW